MRILIKNGLLITDADSPPRESDLLVAEGKIAALAGNLEAARADKIIDARGKVIVPGFVQTHVHLCQALFRGSADDLTLLTWLKERIWPLEALHSEESTYYSALLGGLELLKSGTTCVGVMESVRHTEATARALQELGIRAVFGKAMMDFGDTPGQLGALPGAFQETTEETLRASLKLLQKWHGAAGGRLHYAFCPRGILTTSEKLLHELKGISDREGVLIHTHACENREESALVEARRGLREIKYLHRLGLTGPRLLLAHCVWVDEEDMAILGRTSTRVAHCPSANLKLGSGIAPTHKMLQKGITLSLGADGAPCNNSLNIFQEMRLAALLPKGVTQDAAVMPAREVFRMATLGGARALGREEECGSIAVGKKADLVFLNLKSERVVPSPDPVAAIVYAAGRDAVRDVMVDGRFLVREGRFLLGAEDQILTQAQRALNNILITFAGR
ncbi:MAG: 5-methylthioadenosine/S-adenosylhomocysteine deaminase [Clostridia bacterium]|nr:5-methylthioadenosine/S-adenosylhomocysteine deaminase [Clostridia bacterium]